MFEILPEETLHQILAICLSVHYDVFANRSPAGLLARRTEAAHLPLVCQRWQRVATPLVYETVILTSQSQASDFASRLRHESLGSHVKKLRIEGGFGQALHRILSRVPRLVYICIFLDITSNTKGAGLCTGLGLINPQHVVLRDRRALGNQGVRSVVDALIVCMTSVWTNMISYDHPYDERLWNDQDTTPARYRARKQRTTDLARALPHIPKLKIVYVPRAYYIHNSDSEDDVVLSAARNPSVQKIYSWTAWQEGFPVPLDKYPRLRDLVHLPLPGPWAEQPTYAAIGHRDTSSELRSTFSFNHLASCFTVGGHW